MATDESASKPAVEGPQQRPPLSPVQKKRLQQCFERASKVMAQPEYDFNYVGELLTTCVLGDPASDTYVVAFVENLSKRYKNNRKGAPMAGFKEGGARKAIKKAEAAGQWDEMLKNGLQVLKVNPWDVVTLRALGTAAKNSGDFLSEMRWLKFALEANAKDPDTNIQCAKALAERKQFDQAIACWHRVEQLRPEDEEPQRAISELTMLKTMQRGGFEEEKKKPTAPKAQAAQAAAEAETQKAEAEAEEHSLRRKILKDPKNMANHFELAEAMRNKGRFAEAEEVYSKAYEISGNDPDVRERWIDVQLQRARAETVEARNRRKESPEAEQEYRRLRKELNDKEMQRAKFLCERYPNNLRFKYDLAIVYRLMGKYGEAIKEFQAARNDPRCKGLCLLGLGQCFQAIKQGRLAIHHFELAVQEIPDRDADNKKEALYLAAKMAMDELKDYKLAEKHLSMLAGFDFSYKDVADLLAKIAEMGMDGEASPPAPGGDSK
jgi:tetratricopeptide (TPR) repeat protein